MPGVEVRKNILSTEQVYLYTVHLYIMSGLDLEKYSYDREYIYIVKTYRL